MAKTPKKSDNATVNAEKPKAAKKSAAGKSELGATAPVKAAPAKPAPVKAAQAAPADKRPAAKKPAAKPALMGGGLVDSGLLASSAANFLLARAKGRHQMQAENTASISQIKSDLAKPASAVAGELIDQHSEGTGGKRPNLPGGHGAPHSQTVGHANQRTSVPRRTAG